MAGAASLPFRGRRAGTPRTESTFGLSSFPPSIQPWQNTGTAAATIKLMIYRGLTSYAPDGSLRGQPAGPGQPIGTQGRQFKLRDARFQNGEKVTSADVRWTIDRSPRNAPPPISVPRCRAWTASRRRMTAPCASC